jgi:hypothetical protein
MSREEISSIAEEETTDSGRKTASQIAEEIINKRYTLNELFGDDWKENCILDSVEKDLTPLELEQMKGLETNPTGLGRTSDNISKKTRDFAITVRGDAEEMGFDYKTRYFRDENGEEKVFILGKMSGMKTYMVTSSFRLDFLGRASWTPEKWGLITEETGEVLSISNLLENDNQKNESASFTIMAHKVPTESDRTSWRAGVNESTHFLVLLNLLNERALPATLHELSHLARIRSISRDTKKKEVYECAWVIFNLVSANSNPKLGNNNPEIPGYVVRKIKAGDERGASATALSLMSECNTFLKNRDMFPKTLIESARDHFESALMSYDSTPYDLRNHPDEERIPTFSQYQRTAARNFHKVIQDGDGSTYSNIRNFDYRTGKSVSSDPAYLLDHYKEHLE